MRMTSVFVLAVSLHVHAHSYSQTVSLRLRNSSLDKVFRVFNKQTRYSFIWDQQLLAGIGPLNIEVHDIPLRAALDQCLAGTPLTYFIRDEDRTVYILRKDTALDYAQPPVEHTVTGVIKDSTGAPMEGVSVVLKRGSLSFGGSTDKTGTFTIRNVPEGSYTLNATYIGYAAYQHKYSVGASTPALVIVLYPSASDLNETVVIGYGTQTRRELTAAVATTDMAKVAEIASPSINDELGGRMPGVFVTTDGGGPGAQASIYVRGGNSGNNPPLFVIDGFIRTETDYLNINPNDVESFVVLKDAEATAIYGSQGGNGVIVVTTKKGSYNSKPVFNLTANQIWTQPTVRPKTVSSYTQASGIDKIYSNLGLTPPYADSVLQHYKNQDEPYVYPNTNWRNLVLKPLALEDRYDLSVSAGNQNLKYYAGLSYYDQASLLRLGSSNATNRRVTWRLNVENNLPKLGLKITAGFDGYVNRNMQPYSVDGGYYGIYSHLVDLGPTQVATNQYGLPYVGTGDNPLMESGPKAGYSKNSQTTLNGILGLDWQLPFFKDVHIKGVGMYNAFYGVNKVWYMTAPGYDFNSTTPIYVNEPYLQQGDGNGSTLDLQAMVTYNHSFGKNHIGFTGVYEQIQSQADTITAERVNYLIDIDQFFVGPTSGEQASGASAQTASEGYVGRLQYNYADKYFVEGSLRYDGSYLFAPDKRFGTFYGLSGGWIPTEEKFMDFLKTDHILDYFKIRGSYGVVGNTTGITPYEYLSTYSTRSNTYNVGGTEQLGLYENGQLPSTSFSWYSNASTNIGIDFATLNSRLKGSIDRFYYVTKGFVVSDTAYSATLGVSLPYVNSPASERTSGIELGINWDDHIGKLKYHVGVTYSTYSILYPIYPGETATALENPATRKSGKTDQYYNFSNGANSPSSNFNTGLGYVATGLYSSNAAAQNGPRLSGASGIAAGDIIYKDENGDGQINSLDERLVGKNNFAHTNYGLNVSLSYEGWSLDAVFMATGGRDVALGSVLQGQSNMLQYPFEYNYWTPTNTHARFPRALPSGSYNSNNNLQNSSFWLVSAQYFRLKSLNLSYDLKKLGFLRNFGPVDRFKVFVTGRNLFTISSAMKYNIDPESDPNGWAYGVQRTFAVGCNVGF